jgi:hypothetical protein
MSNGGNPSLQALTQAEARQVVGGVDLCDVVICPFYAVSSFFMNFLAHTNEGTWAAWHG